MVTVVVPQDDRTVMTRSRVGMVLASDLTTLGIPFAQPDSGNAATIWQLALWLNGITVVTGSPDPVTGRIGR